MLPVQHLAIIHRMSLFSTYRQLPLMEPTSTTKAYGTDFSGVLGNPVSVKRLDDFQLAVQFVPRSLPMLKPPMTDWNPLHAAN